jgi:hypothetical protein
MNNFKNNNCYKNMNAIKNRHDYVFNNNKNYNYNQCFPQVGVNHNNNSYLNINHIIENENILSNRNLKNSDCCLNDNLEYVDVNKKNFTFDMCDNMPKYSKLSMKKMKEIEYNRILNIPNINCMNISGTKICEDLRIPKNSVLETKDTFVPKKPFDMNAYNIKMAKKYKKC